MALTELPLGLAGRLFRCAMPFSDYDREGRALDAFAAEGVGIVVVLAERDECLRVTRRDLLAIYRARGLRIIEFPMRNLGVVSDDLFAGIVTRVLDELSAGHSVAVHCHAGVGRAGTLAACLARAALGLTGDEAIAWVRGYVPDAIETHAQEALIQRFLPPA
jgi:rhodanese/phosphatase family protein